MAEPLEFDTAFKELKKMIFQAISRGALWARTQSAQLAPVAPLPFSEPLPEVPVPISIEKGKVASQYLNPS